MKIQVYDPRTSQIENHNVRWFEEPKATMYDPTGVEFHFVDRNNKNISVRLDEKDLAQIVALKISK